MGIRALLAAPGSPVPEPTDLHSEHGVLKVDLSIHDFKESDGSTRYCYLLPDGSVAPDCTEGAAARQPLFYCGTEAQGAIRYFSPVARLL
jgi:hypothetical protein